MTHKPAYDRPSTIALPKPPFGETMCGAGNASTRARTAQRISTVNPDNDVA